jgi:fatty acid desaturase
MVASVGSYVGVKSETADRAASLTQRSDWPGIVQLAGHLFALALTTLLVSASAGHWWLPLALLVHGIVLIFLFAPLHESLHRTAFRSRWINSVVTWLCGAVLMLPPKYFRAFHFTHHRYTQDPARDPELAYPKPTAWPAYLWTVSGVPYWWERMTTLAQNAMGRVTASFVSAPARSGIVGEARVLLGVYGAIAIAALAAGSTAPILYWLVPVLLGQPFLRMYLLAEHTGCPLVGDMLVNTRTTLTNGIMRRLAWNMPFHTAHHVHPGVPFHRLPELHQRIREGVRFEANGYWRVQRELTRGFRGVV